MNKLLLLGLLVLPMKAHAQAQAWVTPVATQEFSSMTCGGVSIASFTSSANAAVLFSTTTMMYRHCSVQNRNSSINVFCGDTVNVTSGTASAVNVMTGQEVYPLQTTSFSLYPGQPWYCVNDSTYTTTNSTVCKGY